MEEMNIDGIHPCLEINNISRVVTRTSSTKCSLLFLFLGSLSVITVFGNILVITAILYFKQLHTPSNYLILSLAVTDLLVGLVVFPISIFFTLSSCSYYRDLFCKIRDSFDVVLSTTSIFNLCFISVDRYYAVCRPLTYRMEISTPVVVVMILLSWGTSVAIAVGFVAAEMNQATCTDGCFHDVVLEKILAPVFSFYLPVLVMLYIYGRIFFVARRQVRSIQATATGGATVSNMERKATKTLAIVLGAFLTCWLPFFLCFSLQLLGVVSMPLYETMNWFTLCNSMLNPFIYGFFYSWFRSAFKMIISGKIFQGSFTNYKLQ